MSNNNRENVLEALKGECFRSILFFEHKAPKLAEILHNNLNNVNYSFDFRKNDYEEVINILEREFLNLKSSFEAYNRLANEPITSVAIVNAPRTILNESSKTK